jgi:putative transcriptional regulator
MEVMRWLRIAAVTLYTFQLAEAQSMRPADLAAGKLLVASRELPDPNFAKTVILLVQYDDDGVVGLILNRRSKVPVSRVLDELAGAKNRPDPVYAGGPVGRTDVLALVRGHSAAGDAKRVLGDVFLVSTKEAMEKTFASGTDADTVHVYLGYAGWTAPQLEHEVDLGAWYIFQGSAKAVFDSDPDSLWERLLRETELRMAYAGAGGIFRLRAAGGGQPRLD